MIKIILYDILKKNSRFSNTVSVLGHCMRILKERKKCYIVITIIIYFLRNPS